MALPGAILLVTLVLASGCEPAASREGEAGRPPVAVQVVELEAVEVPLVRSAVGSLRSPQTAVLVAEVAGNVVGIEIPEGEPVERGRVLVRIDDAEIRAALTVAEARSRQAEDRLKRVRALHEQEVTSEQELDDAERQAEGAAGELEEVKERLAKTVLRAPFDGIVGLRELNRGDYARVGEPVVKLTRTDPLELVFGIPQRYAGDVARDQLVYATVGRCGERFEGRVVAVDPVVDDTTRNVRVQARVPNPERRLLPGMAAEVRLVVGHDPDGLIVPQEALVRQGTKHLVYVLNEQNEAEQREVVLGEHFADGVGITSGLEPGARVVTSGHQKLRPGARAAPEPHEPTENPNQKLGWLGSTAGC